jgi:hypothetical protein
MEQSNTPILEHLCFHLLSLLQQLISSDVGKCRYLTIDLGKHLVKACYRDSQNAVDKLCYMSFKVKLHPYVARIISDSLNLLKVRIKNTIPVHLPKEYIVCVCLLLFCYINVFNQIEDYSCLMSLFLSMYLVE